jgi:OOP family OmpA-OmpF porin
MRAPLVAALTLVLVAGAAARTHAAPPASAAYVDPGAPCFRWPAVDYDGDGVFDRVDRCNNTPHGCTVDNYGCSTDSDGDGVCDGVDQCPDTPRGVEVNAKGCPPRAAVQQRQYSPPPPPPPPTPEPPPVPTPTEPMGEGERTLLETGQLRLDKIYFESGSAKILDESKDALDQLGRGIEKHPELKLEIQGHTDTRGSAALNQKLSQQRAEAVRAYIIHNFRVNPDNLTAKGYGESHPETKERNQEELLRNRRVVLKKLN